VVIEDETELAGLLHEAQGIDLSGALELDATVEILADRLLPHIVVKAEDVTVGSKQFESRVEGLTTTVTFDSLTPLATPSHQRIEVARAHVGNLRVQDGVVDFRVESPDAVFIERAQCGWAGGRLYTYALRFDPSEPVRLVAYGDRLNLADVLTLLPDERAKGRGTVYGRLPVTVRWPKLKFGEGFLYGTPGEQGWVSLRDAERLAAGLKHEERESFADRIWAQVKERVEAALADFEYDVLKIDFVDEGGELVGYVRLRGRGPEIRPELPEPTLLDRLFPPRYDVRATRQEFHDLVLRIPRVDEHLSRAIIVKKAVEKGTAGIADPGPRRKGDKP
jgi:hypothetical protein